MSATDPQETVDFNQAMHARIIACGAVPVTNDLQNVTATNRLFRQLINLLSCGGGGGGVGLFALTVIEPGMLGSITAFFAGPSYEGPAAGAFGVGAFGQMQPVFQPGPGSLGIQLPPGAVGVFTVPPAATWITAVVLSPGVGTAYNIDISTNLVGVTGDTLIPFSITAGAITVSGAIGIGVLVP